MPTNHNVSDFSLALVRGSLCLLIMAWLTQITVAQRPHELNDLLSGFKANYNTFKNVRITNKVRVFNGPGQPQFRDGEMAQKYFITGQFWSDGKRFEVRQHHDATKDTPIVVASSDNLATVFENAKIYWFDPNSKTKSRYWQGVNGGIMTARVGNGAAEKYVNTFVYPPLAFTDESWCHKSQWHAIDSFFALPVDGFTATQNDGGIVHVTHETRIDYPTKLAGKFKSVTRINAEIDTTRGFLPIRMTWQAYLERDGEIYIEKPLQFQEMKVTDIQKTVKGFYPRAGEIAQFSRDPQAPTLTLEEYEAGKRVDEGILMLRTKMFWEAVIEEGVDLNAEFGLVFPKGTVFYNESGEQMKSAGGNG